ncbi:MAG: hypothetical protein P8Y69_01110 [Gammaproteobacteria bacterium]|jgi:hypothetical protein
MRFNWLVASLALAAVAGCSGGAKDLSPDLDVNVSLAAITPETAATTTAAVIKSIDGAFSAGEGALGFTGAIGARVATDGAAASDIALEMAERASDAVASASFSTAVGAVITQSQDCSGGGSSTISIDTGQMTEEQFTNALQEGSIPQGTSVTMTFADCIEGEDSMNGSLTIVFQQFDLSGEVGLDTFTLQFSAIFDDFSVGNAHVDGDIGLLVMSTAGATDAQIGGDSLEVSSGLEALALTDYDVTAVEDNVALTQTFDFTLDVSVLGRLLVETLEAWRTDALAAYPGDGTLRIVGADDASITVVVLDEVNVQLDVDSDGDGVVDTSVMTTWAELDS